MSFSGLLESVEQCPSYVGQQSALAALSALVDIVATPDLLGPVFPGIVSTLTRVVEMHMGTARSVVFSLFPKV